VSDQPHVIHQRDYHAGILVRRVIHDAAAAGRTWGLIITVQRTGGFLIERGVITVSGPADKVRRFNDLLNRIGDFFGGE
jgi:hypothetical protein